MGCLHLFCIFSIFLSISRRAERSPSTLLTGFLGVIIYYVNVFIDTDEVNSLLDIDGGIGYDYVVIWNNETEIDFSLYLKHFDSFENYKFNDSSPQNITIDEEDFIEISGSYLGIQAGDEDTIILPEGAEEDTSIINDYYDYYVLNDITIAISDNSLIG